MFVVICYDISDSKLRDQTAQRILDFGVRIQESVYECVLDQAGFERMMRSLQQVPLEKTDRVRVYHLCQRCVEQIVIYGDGEVTEDPECYLV